MKKYLALICCLVTTNALADEGWVSVGSPNQVVPVVTPEQANDTGQLGLTETVVPAQPYDITSPTFTSPTHAGASDNGSLISELLMQIDQMQSEISELRSLTEQQQRAIADLEKKQQTRYLDVDSRLSAIMRRLGNETLAAQSVESGDVTSSTQTSSDLSSSTNNSVSSEGYSGLNSNSIGPQSAYKMAMDLLKSKQYEEANSSFSSFINTYPTHSLVANALYWRGEVLLVQEQYQTASASFVRVVNDFPEHSKAADATYKLGVTYHRLGNLEEARRWLTRVINNYGNSASSTVSLAKRYLESM